MSRRAVLSWYVDGSPSETIERAVGKSVDESDIVDVLYEREYENLERRRVESIVSAAIGRIEQREREASQRQSSTEEQPRSLPDRYADSSDVEYLSDDEFARLLSVTFERFGGSTFHPEVRDSAVDLFWNRSHDTVAVRSITRPDDEPVGEAELTEVLNGNTTPTQGRDPSTVVAVTNTSFSTGAATVAEANGIELYDEPHVSYWLSKARIDRSLAGDILEHGAKRDYDMEERLAEEPTPPSTVRNVDPLEISVETDHVSTDASPTPNRAESIPTDEDRPAPGELGSLYADPSEDGDFGAFDRFADKLDEISEEN